MSTSVMCCQTVWGEALMGVVWVIVCCLGMGLASAGSATGFGKFSRRYAGTALASTGSATATTEPLWLRQAQPPLRPNRFGFDRLSHRYRSRGRSASSVEPLSRRYTRGVFGEGGGKLLGFGKPCLWIHARRGFQVKNFTQAFGGFCG